MGSATKEANKSNSTPLFDDERLSQSRRYMHGKPSHIPNISLSLVSLMGAKIKLPQLKAYPVIKAVVPVIHSPSTLAEILIDGRIAVSGG